MKKTIILTFLAIIGIILLIVLFTSVYILDEVEQAVVLRFGEIRRVVDEPGVYFKTPFVDNVQKLEKRLMLYDIESERILTQDKKTVIVDTIAIWKIEDPQLFIESLRTADLALGRIDDTVYSYVRDTIARYEFSKLISEERFEILDIVKENSYDSLREYGVHIETVRIKRSDLPDQNTQAVYNRMKSERNSMASQIRSEGEREAQTIRAEADKQAVMLISDARRKAEIIRGTAEASSTSIYAEAYEKDPDFFELLRLVEIYEGSMKDAVISIPPDSPLLKFLYEAE